MAQPSNTFDTYDAVGIREDLQDVIYSIAPTDTPFMSSAAREAVKNTLHEWQTDSLASASTSNAVIEGDDVTLDAVTATTRLSNTTQIMDKSVVITGTQEAVDKAGRASELAYQIAKKSKELKRDMEATVTGNIQEVTGGSSTARKMGTTTDELAQMSHLEQMEKVREYFMPYKGRLNSAADLYMAIYYPAAVGKGPSFSIYNHFYQQKGAAAARESPRGHGETQTQTAADPDVDPALKMIKDREYRREKAYLRNEQIERELRPRDATAALPDFSDGELKELLVRAMGRARASFTVADPKHLRIAARRLGKGRGAVGFGNARAVEALVDLSGERQTARVVWERRRGGNPNVFEFQRFDLLGAEPTLLDAETMGPVDAVTQVPAERFDVAAVFSADQSAPGKSYARHGAFVQARKAAIAEAHRVLRPGGRFLCLEFSQVRSSILRRIYDAWSFNALPLMGRLVAGDADSYRYLAESIRTFPTPEVLADMFASAGFAQIKVRSLSVGIACIHSGWKLD